MQQRASLCRALIHEPDLLMLDEPFGALDAFTREELWCVIRDLHFSTDVTVVLVTHDLREAVFLADRMFVMSARPGQDHHVSARCISRVPVRLKSCLKPSLPTCVHDLRGHDRHGEGATGGGT
jgi:NitT/TauT family transport system ATP-binding protein